jgi:hypothetical protein
MFVGSRVVPEAREMQVLQGNSAVFVIYYIDEGHFYGGRSGLYCTKLEPGKENGEWTVK